MSIKGIKLSELADSERANLIREVKKNLHQKLLEARFFLFLAEAEKIVINGQIFSFESDNLEVFVSEDLVER